MADRNAELEEPENWDFEKAEKRPGLKKTRSVVSVALSADDFALVAEYAEQLGMRVSEFLRSAALERARAGVRDAYFVLSSKDGEELIYTEPVAPETSAVGTTSIEDSQATASR